MKKAIYLGIEKVHHDVVQRVFELDPPLEGNQYVCVSANSMEIVSSFDILPETYIFPCTIDGTITDWGELQGSYKGGMSHAQALLNAGYEIVCQWKQE